jgi:hypothetical protein
MSIRKDDMLDDMIDDMKLEEQYLQIIIIEYNR